MATRKNRSQKAVKLLRWAMKSESRERLNAMVELARSEMEVVVGADELDCDPYLLNCVNGTLDLRTAGLRQHRREDLITRLCPTEYAADAQAPRWQAFIASVFAGQLELIDYVQRLLGSCLTGDVSDQCLPIFWGAGSNGKTTLVEIVLEVLGADYASEACEGFLDAGRGGQHPTELTDLYGKRLVLVDEMDEGKGLNERRIKRLTGGNRIRARGMRQDFWEFVPTHKLIVCTNHKPDIQGHDHGFWRRVRLVPFTVRFWKPEDLRPGVPEPLAQLRADPRLMEALCQEKAGILAWLVRGCLAWQRCGLEAPAAVRDATQAYRNEQDLIEEFIATYCVRDVCSSEAGGLLQDVYRRWVRSLNRRPPSPQALRAQLEAAGFTYCRSNGSRYCGLRLTEEGRRLARQERGPGDGNDPPGFGPIQ